MASAAFLSITLVPALMVLFVRGRILPEHKNPINRILIGVYRPVIRLVLRAKTLTILAAVAALAGSFWALDTNWFLRLVNYGVLFAAPVAGVGLVRALQWLRPAWAAWTGVGLATIVSVLSVVRPPALLGC